VVQRELAGITLQDDRQRLTSRWFSLQALLFFAAASIAQQWRLLLGRVPIPVDLVTRRALFKNVPGVPHTPGQHADLNDLAKYFYPFRASSGRSLHDGHLAVWNSRIMEGTPFLANLISAVLYPPNLVLYGLLPASVAWSAGFFLRPVLAGCFTALLARSLGASRAGALVSGIGFAFCCYMVGWGGAPQSDTAVWLPLGLYAIHRLSKAPGSRTIAATAVCLALPVLAGHPEAALFGAGATAIFAAHRAIFRPRESAPRRRYLVAFALATLLAGGLAAAQLLPAVEWIPRLQRYELRAEIPAIPLHDALSFVSRDAQGDPNSVGLHVGGAASYIGLLALVCAPLGLLHRNRRDAIFFAVLAAVTAQVAYGVGPLFWLSQHLPFLHSVANAMVVGVLDLSLVLLAGLGVTVAQGAHRRREQIRTMRVIIGVSVAAGGIALAAAAWYPRHHPHGAHTDWFRGLFASALLIVVAGALCLLATTRRLSATVTSALFVAIALVDSTSYAYGHVPFFRSDQVYPPAPAFTALHQLDSSPYRIAGLDGAYTSNLEMMYGFDSASGYDFPTADAARLLDPLGVQFISYELTSQKVTANRDRRLDVMNLKYLFVGSDTPGAGLLASQPERFASVFDDGAVHVFENRSVLPRAFLVPAINARPVTSTDDAFGVLADPNFDPAHQVLVGPGAALSPTQQPDSGLGRATVSDLHVSDVEVTMSVDTSVQAVVVLSQSMYPGWKVYVDGKSSPLLRTNAMFQGVEVGPGQHRVRFAFESGTVRAGATVSSISLLIVLGLALWPMIRRRARRRRVATE
jgi:hypothetical protein